MYYVNQQVRQDYPVSVYQTTNPNLSPSNDYCQLLPNGTGVEKIGMLLHVQQKHPDSCPFRLPEYKIDIAFSKSLDRICGLDAIKSSPVKSGLGVGYLET